MSKDYYSILGVDKSASKEDIKKAYKKLAKKYHPDISKEENAEVKFKEINEAAGVLLDDQKRRTYDTYGTADGPQGFGSGGGFNPQDFGINLDDIFEQFGFGGFSGSGYSGFAGGNTSQRSRRTQEFETIQISLEDVYFGSEKEISIKRDVKCEVCNGVGAVDPSDIVTCSTCNGAGVIIETQRSILGMMRTQRVCPTCNGTGKKIKNPCTNCGGDGVVSRKETISIKIPKGVESGTTLRVKGKGSYDVSSKEYGDLFVRIIVKNHSKYDVEEGDLYISESINFIQAILGDEIELQHFNKKLLLKIPSGTQPGTVLRLKGRGLPYLNSSSQGDLYVKVNVDIPKKITTKQKEILMDYAKTLDDKSFFKRLKSFFS